MLEEHYILVEHVFQLEVKIFGIIWDLCMAKRYFRKICKTKTFSTRKSEKLEQLRALESGMQIHTIITSEHPIGVDTKSDLKKAENYFKDLI